MPDAPYNPIHGPNWNSPFYAAQRPEPSWERLNAPSTRVVCVNTHEAQTHVVIDRFNVGHELRPGERREMEMLNEEIAHFQEMRLPNRFYPTDPPTLKPPHAILIEGVPLMVDQERAIRDAKQAELAAARKEEERGNKAKPQLGLPG